MSIDSFERYPLLFGPSPVHRLDRLTQHLGGAAIWAKREDCNSGIAYGGNKTRKLEYLVADALAKGCDTLVSIGGVQSNHTRQVAAVAARVGLACVLVQESWVDWPDPVYDKVGNILISRLAGADVRLVRAEFGIGFKDSWEQVLREIEASGGTALRDPGRRLRPSPRRSRLRQLGLRARRARTPARGLLRHHRGVLGHRQHPGRDGRRLRRALRRRQPAAAHPRHRRVGQASANPRPDPPHRPADRHGSSGSSGS